MNEFELPVGVVVSMSVAALISIGLPIGLLIYQVKKKGGEMLHFLVGVMTFVVFALILESICHQFFILQESPISRLITNNKWLYILYGGLAAGIFEETGRLFAFRFLMKKTSNRSAAITYGIGHGGIESILLVGLGMVSSVALLLMVYFGGMESYLEMVPEGAREATRAGILSLSEAPVYTFLAGGVERIAAIVFHIAASVLVFLAVKRKGKFYLYPLAIVLHTLLNIPAGMFQTGILKSAFILELLVFAIAAGVAYFAYRCYQQDKENEKETIA